MKRVSGLGKVRSQNGPDPRRISGIRPGGSHAVEPGYRNDLPVSRVSPSSQSDHSMQRGDLSSLSRISSRPAAKSLGLRRDAKHAAADSLLHHLGQVAKQISPIKVNQ
jgi:hypothetical protein